MKNGGKGLLCWLWGVDAPAAGLNLDDCKKGNCTLSPTVGLSIDGSDWDSSTKQTRVQYMLRLSEMKQRHGIRGDFFVVFSVVALSVQQPVVDDHHRCREVNQFARGQHAQVRPGVATSVAVARHPSVKESIILHMSKFQAIFLQHT